MTRNSYRMQSSFTWALYALVMPVAFSIFGFGVVYATIFHPQAASLPPGILIVWLIGVAWVSYRMVQMPYRIEVRENEQIEFVGLGRRAIMRPTEILSIKPKTLQPGFLVVRHSGGRFYLVN